VWSHSNPRADVGCQYPPVKMAASTEAASFVLKKTLGHFIHAYLPLTSLTDRFVVFVSERFQFEANCVTFKTNYL
jgi:hypothetical protein